MRDPNVIAKELILSYIDSAVLNEMFSLTGQDEEIIKLVIMNRNRVAKFLGLPSRQFGRKQ